MLFHPLGTETSDGRKSLQGLRRAPGQFHSLAVVAQHVVGDPFMARSIPPPLEYPVVPSPLHFVQVSEQIPQHVRPFIVLLFRLPVHHRRALKDSGFQEDAPVGPAAMDKELRLRSDHLPIDEVLPQHGVVEQAGRFIPAHCHDLRLDQRHAILNLPNAIP